MQYLRQIIGIGTLVWSSLALAQAPRNVTEALTQHNWLWTDAYNQTVPMTFHADGTATLLVVSGNGKPEEARTWKWRPHSDPLKLWLDKQGPGGEMMVQFDAQYTHFEGISPTGNPNSGARVFPSVRNAAPAFQAATQSLAPSANSVEQVKAAILGHAWVWHVPGWSIDGNQMVFQKDGTMTSPTGWDVHTWRWKYDEQKRQLLIVYKQGDSEWPFTFNADYTRIDRSDKNTFAVRAAPLPATPSNQTAAVPTPLSRTVADAIARKLENSQWSYTNKRDVVSVPGGGSITKDGAWLGLRFRGQGRFTAWHDQRILHESRWEVITANTVRLHNCGPDPRVGLVLQFDPGFTSFTISNYSNVSGRRTGQAPNADVLVGRWHWNGPGTVHFREDGMAFMEWQNGERGTWRSLGGDRYEANWSGGKFVDTIRMKSGNKELVCEDKAGRKFGAHRVIPK